MTDRPLPSSWEMEFELLSDAVQGASSVERLLEMKPEDFFDEDNRAVFRIIHDLASEPGGVVDYLTISDRAVRSSSSVHQHVQQLFQAGSCMVEPRIEAYVARLRAMSLARQMITLCCRAAVIGLAESTTDYQAFVEQAQSMVLSVGAGQDRNAVQHIRPVMVDAYRHIERVANKQVSGVGIRTGLAELDALIGGLEPGHLNVIGARPSMGKTAAVLGIIRHAVLVEKVPTVLFSLETPKRDIAHRLLFAEARVDLSSARHGNLDPPSWLNLSQSAARLSESPLHIEDRAGASLDQVVATVRRLHRQEGIGLVVIDYLQLMRHVGERGASRDERIGATSGGLKKLAMDLMVPVVALSQVKRDVEDRANKRPRSSDLRESGNLEQDADKILLLYRDEKYNKASPARGKAEIIVDKQKNGPTGTVTVRFSGKLNRFDDDVDDDAPREKTDESFPPGQGRRKKKDSQGELAVEAGPDPFTAQER